MAERIHRDYLFSQSGLHRAELWSKLQQGEIAPQLAVVLQSGTSFRLLFEVAWTGPAWGKDEVGLASAYLAAPHAPYLKASLLAAVTLSLFSSYDARRMDFLLDTLAAVDDAFLYDRALVGVVLALVRHAEVMPFFPEQVRRIHAFVARQERFVRRLRRLQKFLLAILETPTVTKNLEEEVLSLIIDTTAKAPPSALGDDEVRFPDEESPEAAEAQQRLLEHMHRYLTSTAWAWTWAIVLFSTSCAASLSSTRPPIGLLPLRPSTPKCSASHRRRTASTIFSPPTTAPPVVLRCSNSSMPP